MHAQRARLEGGRWHFQHGPIDLVIGAEGEERALADAHADAWSRFETVLPELVAELGTLRRPVGAACPLNGVVARRMWQACHPFRAVYITPMAAVAGSVAEELVACYRRDGVSRAWVNNGGDIALHLAANASVSIGLFSDLGRFDPAAPVQANGRFVVHAALPVRGIATSGWRGRSHSLGIADSVTVLARTAAVADAAATMIANAVDIDDPRIARQPASSLKDDSDLGDIAVTVAVPTLEPELVQAALERGAAHARELQRQGLIHAAMLVCQHRTLAVEPTRTSAQLGSVFA